MSWEVFRQSGIGVSALIPDCSFEYCNTQREDAHGVTPDRPAGFSRQDIQKT
jgi:hypothetical protein